MADSIHSYHIQLVVQLLISASVLLVVMSAENAGLENDVTTCDNLHNQIAAEKNAGSNAQLQQMLLRTFPFAHTVLYVCCCLAVAVYFAGAP